MKKFLLISLSIFMICFVTGCSSSMLDELEDFEDEVEDASYVYPDSKEVIVSLDEFQQLKSGMSEKKVWGIIGGECTNTGTTDLGIGKEYVTVTYGCNGNGSIGSNVVLMFQGGKLKTMSQVGLK